MQEALRVSASNSGPHRIVFVGTGYSEVVMFEGVRKHPVPQDTMHAAERAVGDRDMEMTSSGPPTLEIALALGVFGHLAAMAWHGNGAECWADGAGGDCT